MASCSAPSRASARSTSSRSITGPEGPVTPIDHPSLSSRYLLCRRGYLYWAAGGPALSPRVPASQSLYDFCQPSLR